MLKKILMTLSVAILLISTLSAPKDASARSHYKSVRVSATAYNEMGRTATGYRLWKHPRAKVIAVDPRVIPLGSKVYVPGYGTAVARDTGGAIKGKIIDVHFKTRHQAIKWGRKHVKIKVYRR
ncbi:3D domain-containing protein [Sporolactobacillus vineae]|uniref:3D domain-containing protein n=1 Tax=Sporolactobacillus vineae TaxID=444463 RepID=UPI000287FB4A|nr:3D domain-containing protein [Sporolactobacillus vineae]